MPKHRAPDVVSASGMTEDGYIPVESRTLATRYPGVYAIGDVATVGRVDVDFLSGPKPTGAFREPSSALVAEKSHFGSSRKARWFGH